MKKAMVEGVFGMHKNWRNRASVAFGPGNIEHDILEDLNNRPILDFGEDDDFDDSMTPFEAALQQQHDLAALEGLEEDDW